MLMPVGIQCTNLSLDAIQWYPVISIRQHIVVVFEALLCGVPSLFSLLFLSCLIVCVGLDCEYQVLALFLLAERGRGKSSPWSAYLDTLPAEVNQHK